MLGITLNADASRIPIDHTGLNSSRPAIGTGCPEGRELFFLALRARFL